MGEGRRYLTASAILKIHDSSFIVICTVVYKEYPDVGVFIFQVGEGNMKGSSNGIGGGPVGPVGILQGVCSVQYAALNVGQYHSLEALYND